MEKINQAQRAYNAWPLLIDCAKKGKTITYGDLASKLNLHHRAIRYILDIIQSYCLSERLPPLTILVVSKIGGKPGDGFIAWDIDHFETGLQKVFQFNWNNLENPFQYAEDGSTEDQLVDELLLHPDTAGEVFSRVKARGVAQVLFRKALLRAYEHQCAFCGLTFENALEASHIVPWAEASPQQRLDPRNGILLCSIHHKLFDTGLMTINKAGKIFYLDAQEKDGPYSSSDKSMTIDLHGKDALLPESLDHRPSLDSLTDHHKRYELKC